MKISSYNAIKYFVCAGINYYYGISLLSFNNIKRISIWMSVYLSDDVKWKINKKKIGICGAENDFSIIFAVCHHKVKEYCNTYNIHILVLVWWCWHAQERETEYKKNSWWEE